MANELFKVTLRELIAFLNVANGYLNRFPVPTKLSYALARMVKRGLKETEKMDAAMEDVRSDHALEDKEAGAILRDERNNFKFDKAGLKAVMQKSKEWLDKSVEVEPYFAKTVPKDLASDFRVAFEGFVIDPDAPWDEQKEPDKSDSNPDQAAAEGKAPPGG